MLVWSLCLRKYYRSIRPLSITAPPALRVADGDAACPSCVQAQAGLYVGQEGAVYMHAYDQFGQYASHACFWTVGAQML